ncbi:UDP-N-acetylglucosamine 2-epimerase [Cyclobacterium sp.]|uniref:UDP-N-acetylglucosamine 2-epimerase n=1 Tax=Cyclobacterium sp. TaxID=1966343 RepID=UPI0019BF347F|nr:UDP-N-acetylglucosamine 2-epimerase [Cyclobacterium sp.]MBD3627920.1 UDP-N-acetylglucosamine 2-epimerase (hydrolyzing) [Cyclobacterium sp.]
MRIAVLTSSRADYGIYLPLLKAIKQDNELSLKIIAFGTHLSKYHGYTIGDILNDGFEVPYRLESLLTSDSPNGVATSYALTAQKFADFWYYFHDQFDLVFVLGDRFEMAAAVAASVPFQIPIAHLHGGETTLGAIDTVYRHSISLCSKFHFVSTAVFAQRIHQLFGFKHPNVYHVGSLSLENLIHVRLLSYEEFNAKWDIDLRLDSILVTVHPETVAYDRNQAFCDEIVIALKALSKKLQIIITMPNADTAGLIFRNSFMRLAKENPGIRIVENFGTQAYFTCMKHVKLLIGNTSSGIIEAASFNKYVLNLGERQKGRFCGENVVHLPFDAKKIIGSVEKYLGKEFIGENIYYQPHSSAKILTAIKEYYASV